MKHFFTSLACLAGLALMASCGGPSSEKGPQNGKDSLKQEAQAAEHLFDLSFTDQEHDSLVEGLRQHLQFFKTLHQYHVPNETAPAYYFDPRPVGFKMPTQQVINQWNLPENVQVPENKAELAFYSVPQLASLIKARKITSVELTKLYLSRLKQYGDTLHCLITLMEDDAMKAAQKADEELAAGHYRGPLQGIPFGVKDLMAVKGHKTTWGAGPYQDQDIEHTATVVKRLKDAGAVLVAKLSMGALAMGDVWYGGKTRNPWDLEQGSSGSSAGSAAATSAGLVGFTLGTETWGSIISPSHRCGVTGLRPTFGRVPKTYAMALSWTMDKIGPICRSALGDAMVLDVIRGADGMDRSVVDAPFNWPVHKNLSDLKVAYAKDLFEEDYPGKANDSLTLETLRQMGVKLTPIAFPKKQPVMAMSVILDAEAGAAFDELTRSNADEQLVRQTQDAWPNIFRAARFIPAVEYINANRIRRDLMRSMDSLMKNYDVVITPALRGDQPLITNLTGQPAIGVPNGFDDEKHPTSIVFLGNLYDEASILHLANAYQEKTSWDEKHPPLFMK